MVTVDKLTKRLDLSVLSLNCGGDMPMHKRFVFPSLPVGIGNSYTATEKTIDIMTGPHATTRRALLSAGAASFAGSFLLDAWAFGSAAGQSSDAVWRQRWGDATHRKFVSTAPAPDTLSQDWSATPGPGVDLTVECIGPDNVYVRDYDRLIAYSRANGTQAWRYEADEGSLSLPTLLGDTVLVQENATVHAIDRTTGQARWRGHFASSRQPFSTVVAREGRAYLPDGSEYLSVEPGSGFHHQSFDSTTLGTLVAADSELLVWWADGTLRVTDPDGAVQWSRTLGRSFPPSGRTIAVTDDAVILRHRTSSDGAMVSAFGRENGQPRFRVRDRIEEGVTLTAGPETVYLTGDFHVLAVDAATGEVRWRLTTGESTPAPVASAGLAYVLTDDGVAPVDPATGVQRGNRVLAGQRVDSLAAVPGGLYAVTDQTLVALGGSA